MRRIFITVLLSAAVLFQACATIPKGKPIISSVTVSELPSAIKALEQRRAQLKSAKIMGRIEMSGRGMTRAYNFALVSICPERFRIDMMDQVADVVLSISIDGDQLTAFFPLEDRVYKGPATREKLKELTGLDVSVEEFKSLVLGLPPFTAKETDFQDGGRVVAADNAIQFDRMDGAVLPSSFTKYAGSTQEKTSYRVTFGGYQTYKGVGSVPNDIVVEFAKPRVKIALKYQSVELNGVVDPSLFQLAVRSEE